MLEHALVGRPYPGQHVSGDTAVVRPLENGLFVAIVDVLWHCPEAHELAVQIHDYLSQHASADVTGLMTRLHKRLRGTRGAAVGLCAIDATRRRVEYTGVGNTVIRRFGSTDTRVPSQPGVLGQNMHTPRMQALSLDADDVLVLYTDGVMDRFSAKDCVSMLQQPPTQLVQSLLRRFGKDYDDATCIAVRYAP